MLPFLREILLLRDISFRGLDSITKYVFGTFLEVTDQHVQTCSFKIMYTFLNLSR